MVKKADVLSKHLFIYAIANISTVFLGDKQPGIYKLFNVVRNRWLCQIEHIYNVRTLGAAGIFFDFLYDAQAVGVSQCLAYTLYIFRFHNGSIEKCKFINLFFDCLTR